MSRASNVIERCLWAAGLMALAACALVWLNARLEQNRGNQELDRLIVSAPKTRTDNHRHPAYDSVIGRIQIPRLGVSAVVFEGTDSSVLGHGVGHLSASRLPGERGNIVFAGHRDTFFRALKDVHFRDIITVTTQQGTRRYLVQTTSIVDPDETSVLKDTPASTLTLITCYPFYYVGQAPQRFVVQSTEITRKSGRHREEAVVPARPKQVLPLESEPAPAVAAVESNNPDRRELHQMDPSKPTSAVLRVPADWIPPVVKSFSRSMQSLMNPVQFAGMVAQAIRNSGQ